MFFNWCLTGWLCVCQDRFSVYLVDLKYVFVDSGLLPLMIGYSMDFATLALLAALLTWLENFSCLAMIVPRYYTWLDQFIRCSCMIIFRVS